MNSSSNPKAAFEPAAPVSPFDYRDMNSPMPTGGMSGMFADSPSREQKRGHESKVPTPQEIEEMLRRAHAEAAAAATAETEKRLRADYDAKLAAQAAAEAAKVGQTIDRFVSERKNYFLRVEAEVVKLALAIAAKILHREAQMDPFLLMALVRMAVEKLQEGSKVSVRVRPENANKWRDRFTKSLNGTTVTVIEDAQLAAQDCILETDLGAANFSMDSQLKEIEQGFFDLLAQRPI